MPQSGPIKVDLQQVLNIKMGRKARWVPHWLVKWLAKTICQDQLNELIEHNYPRSGADFCRGVLNDLNVSTRLIREEQLPDPINRRIMIVSNHPLGGLDGMALIDTFQHRYGGQIFFLVNDMLMAIKPLSDVFLPINKVGKQSRESLQRIDNVMAGNDPILIFPSGLVSRMDKKGKICDLEWKKMFVNKARKYKRDIIPLYFNGQNSNFFYKFARYRKLTGLKFNIEMIYLPRELFNSRDKSFKIYCGKPIPWQSLRDGKEAANTAQNIKNIVYSLAND